MDLVKLALEVRYPDGYPDILPEFSLLPVEGELDEDETESLLQGMRTVVSSCAGSRKYVTALIV